MHPERGVEQDARGSLRGRRRRVRRHPVDRVKPKASTHLQRERNLAADPRATLLVEHWDRDDWSRLWWVRAELVAEPDGPAPRAADLAHQLADRYVQYADEPFERVLVLRIVRLTGWSAS